ncbi:hypothetical protein [Flavobacterium sp. ASV13]|uniref:hypothetical protein n=1 Tax=Flavobacterium sp. ASV13 TaxID=1506583 RepID=UPI00068E4A28|nr:hypothetical protein [Flavobacterium sp. ASV13]
MKNKLIFIVSLILTVSVNAQIYTPSGTIQGASGNNNIGIGTSTPSTKLDVLGTVKIQSSNSNYDENLRLLPSLTSDYSSIALGAVNGSAGTGIGQWTLIRYPAVNNYMFSLRYNSTDFLNILNNGNVGIGNNAPNAKFHVNGGDIIINNNGSGILRGDNYNYGSGGAIKVNSSNNVSEQYIQLGRGLSGTGAFSPHLTVMSNSGYVGIGITNPTNKLDVNGTIHSKEVKVDMNGWSDFVFKKDYVLPTLQEVEKHITEKGHLENIPSEEEVLKNGINLGEMNSKLLQKIEELTLYMIEQNKTIEELKQEIKNIKSKI